jgi:hypothetical protein
MARGWPSRAGSGYYDATMRRRFRLADTLSSAAQQTYDLAAFVEFPRTLTISTAGGWVSHYATGLDNP